MFAALEAGENFGDGGSSIYKLTVNFFPYKLQAWVNGLTLKSEH